jgi:hypothetical protein
MIQDEPSKERPKFVCILNGDASKMNLPKKDPSLFVF